MFYNKQKPKASQHWKCKHFPNEAFMHGLGNTLSSFSQVSKAL